MPLAVVGAADASVASLNAASQLTNPNLSPAETAQIAQILAELQTGGIGAVQARAQIAEILGTQAATTQTSSSQAQAGYAQSAPSTGPASLESSFYEIPLPQESLPTNLLSAYTRQGTATPPTPSSSAASQVAFSV